MTQTKRGWSVFYVRRQLEYSAAAWEGRISVGQLGNSSTEMCASVGPYRSYRSHEGCSGKRGAYAKDGRWARGGRSGVVHWVMLRCMLRCSVSHIVGRSRRLRSSGLGSAITTKWAGAGGCLAAVLEEATAGEHAAAGSRWAICCERVLI